jgi:hypothetical protein
MLPPFCLKGLVDDDQPANALQCRHGEAPPFLVMVNGFVPSALGGAVESRTISSGGNNSVPSGITPFFKAS